MEPTFTMTASSITVIITGTPYSIKQGDPNFQQVREAVFDKNWKAIPGLVNRGSQITAWTRGLFKLKDNHVTWDGKQIPQKLEKRMLAMAQEGKDPTPFLRFWEKLQSNPSQDSITQLYDFLEHSSIPIAPDGDFLAYKGVRDNYYDHHSGTFLNRPGARFRIPREKVDPNPRNTCSYGFHVGEYSYCRGVMGGKMIICKVNPADVVSIPADHHAKKIRVCAYVVVGHYGELMPDTFLDADDVPTPDVDLDTPGDDNPVIEVPVAEEPEELEMPPDPDEEVKKSPAPKKEVRTPKTKTTTLKQAIEKDFREMTIDELRKYATSIGIKQSGRVAGGKKGLEKTVAAVLRKNAPKGANVKPKPRKPEFDIEARREILQGENIAWLRQHATHKLKIVGASKIPGGKETLIEAILRVEQDIGK